MIDLHCHILSDFPVDVSHSLGAEVSEEDAREVAFNACRLAAQQGITHLVATPHIHADLNLCEGPLIAASAARLQERVAAAELTLQILPGAEIAFSEELGNGLLRGAGLALAGKSYLLIEPPMLTLPLAAGEVFAALRAQGFRPILAHPERVLEFQQDARRLEELVRAGLLLQITAAMLTGWKGRQVRRCCEKLLKAGLVSFVASDAHFGHEFLFAMVPAWQRLVRLCGAEVAQLLMRDNPLAVIEGRAVEPLWEL